MPLQSVPNELGPVTQRNIPPVDDTEKPGFFGSLGAAFQRENSIASFVGLVNRRNERDALYLDGSVVRDPNYDQFELVKGSEYEQFARSFVDVKSDEEFAVVARQLDKQFGLQEHLKSAGFKGMLAQFASAGLDPVNFIPVLGQSAKISRIGGKFAQGAAIGLQGAALSEALLQGTQDTRTLQESTLNVLGSAAFGSALLGGFSLGAKAIENRTAAKLYNNPDWNGLQLTGPETGELVSTGSLSAGAVEKAVKFDFAPVGSFGTGEALGHIGPSSWLIFNSGDEIAIRTTTDIAETAVVFKGHELGDIRPGAANGAVETIQKAALGDVANMTRAGTDIFAEMRLGKTGGIISRTKLAATDILNKDPEVMTLDRFAEEVTFAVQKGEHESPEVMKFANMVRPFLDQFADDAARTGLMGSEFIGKRQENGDFFIPIVYDVLEIIKNRTNAQGTGFEDKLAIQFQKNAQLYQDQFLVAQKEFADLQQLSVAAEADLPTAAILNKVRRSAGVQRGAKFPVLGMFREFGGVKPGSNLALELNNMGVTTKTHPGLFNKFGISDIDNIVASEQELFKDFIPVGETGFLDPADILEAVGNELGGTPLRLETTQQLEQDFIDQLADDLTRAGIDFRKLTSEQIRNKLRNLDASGFKRAQQDDFVPVQDAPQGDISLQDTLRRGGDVPSEGASSAVELVVPHPDDVFLKSNKEDGFDTFYVDAGGEQVASIVYKVEGTELKIENIFSADKTREDAFNTLGTKTIRAVITEFRKQFPEVTKITGERTGGARFGGRQTGGSPHAPKFGAQERARMDDLEVTMAERQKLAEAGDEVIARELAKSAVGNILGEIDADAASYVTKGLNSHLKKRAMQISSKDFREFTENNIFTLMRKYAIAMSTDTALVRNIGDVDLKIRFAEIDDAVSIKRFEIDAINIKKFVTTPKKTMSVKFPGREMKPLEFVQSKDTGLTDDQIKELVLVDNIDDLADLRGIDNPAVQKLLVDTEKQQAARKELDRKTEKTKRKLSDVLSRLRGTYDQPKDPYSFMNRFEKGMLSWNFKRLLGGMTYSAIPDLAMPIFRNGLMHTAGTHMKLAQSTQGFSKASKNARREMLEWGIGIDMTLATRLAAMAEIPTGIGHGGRLARFDDKANKAFGVATLMTPWNAYMKQQAAVIYTHFVVRASRDIAAGTATPRQIRELASWNISKEMAPRIAEQIKTHVPDYDNTLIPSLRDWTDKEAADAFRFSAITQVDKTILTPGQEKPLWMSKRASRHMGQFKSFSTASTQMILVSGMQRRDMEAMNGLLLLTGLGAMTYAVKEARAGREISKDPAIILANAIDRSGATGILFDANNLLEKTTDGKAGISALTGGGGSTRYRSRNKTGAFLGPSVGAADDLMNVFSSIINGNLSAGDVSKARRLVPFQNAIGFKVLMDSFEDGINQKMGLPARKKTNFIP